jgi:serine/threonine protein kinase
MSDVNSQGQGQPPSDVDFVALQPGQTIGRYEIVSILGQGGFGITYRARDAQLDREVAIKEYLPSALAVRQDGITVLPRSTKMADDFTGAASASSMRAHTRHLQRAPAIVRVFDFLEANGTAYIIMELVPGDTLEIRLRKGKLSPGEIDRILWPLLEGLEQVHATGFLHRDIKPANILLDADGNPTLIDFGASRAAIAGRSASMTAIFTPGYAAAEQMTSARQGPWTDIYGVSATLYHAITGAAPPNAFDRMLDDAYQPLGRLLPAGFAPGLLVGIDAGLAVRATDRPQSIAGWRPILAQAGAADTQATMALAKSADPAATVLLRPLATATAVTAPTKRAAGLWIGLAAALLLVAGGATTLLPSPRRPTQRWSKPRASTGSSRSRGGQAQGSRRGARQAARRGGGPPEGRAGGRAAQADRGGDPAQGRSRDGGQEESRGRGQTEGRSRDSGPAEGRGGQEESRGGEGQG